jgi:3-hydroxyisobutyrate dehydrogenase-like beta-hydroxyacid dehydrogenase
MRIGWIGAGRMGTQLITRLLEAGYDVAVYNRTRAKAEPLAALGATIVERPVDLADRDVVCSMVSASKDLKDVMLGENGLLTGDVSPGVICDSSTVSVAAGEAIRAAAAAKGTDVLATPVSGNPAVIAAGKLTVAASGPRAAFDRVTAILNVYGRGVTYVGEGESARLVKIAHNVFLGVVAQSMAEITVLAERGGVSRAAFLGFLNDSVMGSTFTRYKSPAFVHLDYTPTFTPVLLRKDFDLGFAAGHDLDVPMPVAAAAAAAVQAAVSSGRVDEDFAILLDLQARSSGLELKPEDAEVDDGLSAGSGGGGTT